MTTKTRAKIFEVADQLLTEGVRPTQQNVRERLGSGSLTTINRALNEWWAVLGKRFEQSREGSDVPEAVVRLSSRLWNEALAYAEHRYQIKKAQEESDLKIKLESLAQKELKYTSQVSDLNNTIVSQSRLVDSQSERLEQQAKALLEAQEQCYRLSVELEDARRNSDSESSKQHKEQLLEAQVKIRIHEEELSRVRQQNDELRAENAQLKRLGAH